MRLPLLCVALCSALVFASTEAPVSLTASDGTGLKLVKLQARAVVNDPLAFTELTLTFENPLDRVLEGQFKVTLPPGATVSRFAMKLDGRWQEGEVVERQAARRAYEDFLHRRQDPALLEQSGGNEFTAKVFPIPARGIKEVVISYSHGLTQQGAPYVLPLKGMPEVGVLDVQVSGVVGEGTLSKKNFVPNADFVAVPKLNQFGVRSGDLVLARVVPVDASQTEPLTTFTLLVDSSGSRALGWADQTALVKKLLGSFPEATVNVVAFDQDVAPLYAGPASGFGDAQLKQLRDRRALGASNLEAALKFIAGKPTPRVVIIGDGVITAGVTEGPNLTAAVLKLKGSVQRIDAIAVGGLRDEASFTRITAGSLEKDGAVIDGDRPIAEVARRLTLATKSKLAVKIEGATEVWPKTLAGVQAGDAVLVLARLAATAPFKGTIGSKSISIENAQLASIERPMIERAWAQGRIESLQQQLEAADGAPQREAIKKQIVGVSTQNRVLSSLTALLVLETENDYARFNIDRRALTDILVVENGQVKRQHRSAETLAVAKKTEPAKSKRDSSEGKAEKKSATKALEAPGVSDGDDAPNDSADKADVSGTPPMAEAVTAAPAPPPPPPRSAPSPRPVARAAPEPERESSGDSSAAPTKGADPYTGKFKDVMTALQKDKKKGVALAQGWHEEAPGDLLALVAYGEALEQSGDVATAARAYGSIIDLFPARADLRRFAGIRLERLSGGLPLATDTFAKAADQRADHPASHRLLAFALVKAGRYSQAFEAIARGVKQTYPGGRFIGVDQILREDAGLIAAAWIKAEPALKSTIEAKLKAIGGTPENAPSLRFVLNWETDANDVDFHITDAKGNHAFYSQKHLASGGDLYADVTTGYGPECFTIRLPKGKRSGPYTLQAHYYSIGPMGAGMGKLQIIEHDGKGGLRFEERPYVVMVNQAFVDLGTVKD